MAISLEREITLYRVRKIWVARRFGHSHWAGLPAIDFTNNEYKMHAWMSPPICDQENDSVTVLLHFFYYR